MTLQRSSEPSHPALVTVLEVGNDQVVLALEMTVERHLGHPGAGDDRVDPGAANTLPIKEIVRGEQDALARRPRSQI
jgi:hypothetical protein